MLFFLIKSSLIYRFFFSIKSSGCYIIHLTVERVICMLLVDIHVFFVVMKATSSVMSYSWQTLSGPTAVPDGSNTKTVSNGSACGHHKKSELQDMIS